MRLEDIRVLPWNVQDFFSAYTDFDLFTSTEDFGLVEHY
jgi:hypothetical protein